MQRQMFGIATTILLISLSSSSWSGEPVQETPNVATPSVTVIGSRQAESVLGKEVRSATGEKLGRLVYVIVDRSGQIRAAVIDFGGFFGIGNRKIAVEWDALNFASGKPDVVTLDLTRDQIKSAPEYKDRRAVIVVGAATPPTP